VLHAYLKTLDMLRCSEQPAVERKFGGGWIRGYDMIFAAAFGVAFQNGPVSIDTLEDIVLTRNSIQHQVSTTWVTPTHASRKPGQARPLVLDEREVKLVERLDPEAKSWIMPPSVHVDRAKLDAALDSVARFVTWLDDAIETRIYGRE